MVPTRTRARRARPSAGRAGPVAVVDIGSTSIRMIVAQLREGGRIDRLESLQQEVNLGRDVFADGSIHHATVEECVKALLVFRKVLAEYRVEEERVRAFATSAVREAANQDAFLDRIFIATGLEVEVIDDAEVHRYTYRSVQPLLASHPELCRGEALVMEVGGGSTEMLLIRDGQLALTHTMRLGSYRLRESLEDRDARDERFLGVIEPQVQATVGQIRQLIGLSGRPRLLAMGGDARFAAGRILPRWDRRDLARIPMADFLRFTGQMLETSVDRLVGEHHLGYSDAETLGPALLTYARLGQALRLPHLLVCPMTMREGAIGEIATGPDAEPGFREQVLSAARSVGRKYRFDEKHANHVEAMCRRLFRELADEHGLEERWETVLSVAALLHDIGLFVSGRNHHKHTQYLLMHSGLFGLRGGELQVAALVARYHRKSVPRPQHELYIALDRRERALVCKLAAILRIADSLDSGHRQRVRNFTLAREADRLLITVRDPVELDLEELVLREKGDLYRQVFGRDVALARG